MTNEKYESSKIIDFSKFQTLREDFPILQNKIYGKNLIYFDNGASAQKPRCVIDKMHDILENSYANVHRGVHFLSDTATEAYEESRAIVQNFLNAQSSKEIIFTKNATEAINLVAYSFAMDHLQAGDEIILTIMEHHSNLVPWHFIREKKGVTLRFIDIDENGEVSLEKFKAAFTEKTKFVAITHVSNVLGTILPIKEICTFAATQNVPILVDGSQAVMHLPVDVQELNCDWYVFTGHKVYGPTGVGVLYGRERRLERMRPFLGGGEMVKDVTKDFISYADLPYRFEAGTPPIVEAIALGAALEYVKKIGRLEIYAYENILTQHLKNRLKEIKGVKLFGNAVNRAGIFSFIHEAIHAHDLATFLDRQGIAIRSGTHCAQILLDFLGCSSACRISLAMYNSIEEIDRAIEAFEKAIKFFKN